MTAGNDRQKRNVINPIFAGLVLLAAVLATDLFFPKLFRSVEGNAKADCIANLKLIQKAKHDWAIETKAAPDAIPTWKNLQPHLNLYHGPNDRLNCPDGGIYTIGSLTNAPTCTIKGHVLDY